MSVTSLNSTVDEEVDAIAQPVAAFCGVANPQSFFEQVGYTGLQSALNEAFLDHHWYSQTEIESLCRKAKEYGARCLITTAKDAVKLQALNFDLPCYVLHIDISIDDESAFRDLISGVFS